MKNKAKYFNSTSFLEFLQFVHFFFFFFVTIEKHTGEKNWKTRTVLDSWKIKTRCSQLVLVPRVPGNITNNRPIFR